MGLEKRNEYKGSWVESRLTLEGAFRDLFDSLPATMIESGFVLEDSDKSDAYDIIYDYEKRLSKFLESTGYTLEDFYKSPAYRND